MQNCTIRVDPDTLDDLLESGVLERCSNNCGAYVSAGAPDSTINLCPDCAPPPPNIFNIAPGNSVLACGCSFQRDRAHGVVALNHCRPLVPSEEWLLKFIYLGAPPTGPGPYLPDARRLAKHLHDNWTVVARAHQQGIKRVIDTADLHEPDTAWPNTTASILTAPETP